MGANKSRIVGPKTEGPAYDEYLLSMWPGLEDQLVQSYLCHDVAEENAVPYDVLEPVLRHHLMQCGLIEFISRFVTEEGALDSFCVAPYLKRYKLSLANPLTLQDWKHLCLAWIQLVQDSQAKDVSTWQKDLKSLQTKQINDFKNSMILFQHHYLDSLEEYYNSIEDEHVKEVAEREEWEKNQKMQQDFYNNQLGFCQRANDEAVQAWNETMAKQKSAAEQYLKYLSPQRKNHSVLTYSYQVPMDGISGPISGGCRLPTYQKRRKRSEFEA